MRKQGDGLRARRTATAGRALADADRRYELSPGPSGSGVLDFYEKHPNEMMADKDLYRTWIAALSIANSAIQQQAPKVWQSSESLNWMSSRVQSDAWKHPFCVKAGQGFGIVVSAGPRALASLECSSLVLSKNELKSFVRGRLNKHPSGALVLVLTKENAK